MSDALIACSGLIYQFLLHQHQTGEARVESLESQIAHWYTPAGGFPWSSQNIQTAQTTADEIYFHQVEANQSFWFWGLLFYRDLRPEEYARTRQYLASQFVVQYLRDNHRFASIVFIDRPPAGLVRIVEEARVWLQYFRVYAIEYRNPCI